MAAILLLPGCGLIHFGRLPTPDDASLQRAYVDLGIERKILKQELVLARKEEDALRAALDHATAPATGAAPNLTLQLESTTRELAVLRANYAKLQAEKSAAENPPVDPRLAQLEASLKSESATASQLRDQNAELRRELDATQAQNAVLAQQLKSSLAEVKHSRDSIARLNSDVETERQARARAEEATNALQAQLDAMMARAGPANPAPAPTTPAASNSALAALSQAKAPPSGSAPMAVVELHSKTTRASSEGTEPRSNETESAQGPAGVSGPIAPTPVAPSSPPAPAPTTSSTAGSNPAPVAGRTYTVQPGDTLERIAAREYGAADRWTKIYEANTAILSASQGLKPGMELQIPPNN